MANRSIVLILMIIGFISGFYIKEIPSFLNRPVDPKVRQQGYRNLIDKCISESRDDKYVTNCVNKYYGIRDAKAVRYKTSENDIYVVSLRNSLLIYNFEDQSIVYR